MSRYRGTTWALIAGLSFAGCKKSTSADAAQTTAASAAAEAALIAVPAAGPAGFRWERITVGSGSVEVPAGEGWKKAYNPFQVHHDGLNFTLMIQQQAGIPSGARSDYLKSFIDVNARDAPKYTVTAQKEGLVAGNGAGVVDGKFDDGTAYTTRDYVLFVNGAAIAVMVRGPAPAEADVRSLADHVAASYK